MPVSVVFTCEICGVRPDPETQTALERQLLDLRHGEYVDAEPGRWLTWHGRGMYGPQRYACGEHRGELKAMVREHYGTLGWHPGPRDRTRGRGGAAPTARARWSRALRSTLRRAGHSNPEHRESRRGVRRARCGGCTGATASVRSSRRGGRRVTLLLMGR